jgi:hypothetical protein
MKSIFNLFFILLFAMLLLNESCNTTEPTPPNNGTLSISLTDTSCTKAWVELKTSSVAFPVNINILADNSGITKLNYLRSSDTTIYVDSFLPYRSYQLQAQISGSTSVTSSNKITAQILDTTNSNFKRQIYTFGEADAGSNTLFYANN